MTKHAAIRAFIAVMRTLLLFLLLLPLTAAEPDLSEQLRDALYTEEVERDPAKAAESYEAILADFDRQRPLAASALYRLAEVRRKQERKDEAIALYQRLLQEFPDREAEAKLAREHLAELGGELPSTELPANPEQKEIQRLKELAATAPDILRQRETLIEAVKSGNLTTVRFLLDQGADPSGENVLSNAAGSGFIEIAKLLLERGGKPNAVEWSLAMDASIRNKRNEMLAFLLEPNIGPENAIQTDSGTWALERAIQVNNREAIKILIEHGADPNRMLTIVTDNEDRRTTLLMDTVRDAKEERTRLLLEHGADANFVSPDGGVTPLHLSASKDSQNALTITKLLLAAGADPNVMITDYETALEKWGLGSATPLDAAIRSARLKQVEALLDGGAMVAPGLLRSALNHGNNNDSEAEAAIYQLLLKHVPELDPDSPDSSDLLAKAATRSFDIEPLIELGAKPSEEWMESGFKGAKWWKAIPLLNQKFLFPKITSPDRIQLVQTAWHNTEQQISSLTTRSNDSTPPSLAIALFDAELKFYSFDGREMEVRWIVWRKNDGGSMSPTDFDPAQEAPLPDLRWGDIVELRTVGHPVRSSSNNGSRGMSSGQSQGNSPATYWNIRRHISFPIKLTVGEITRDLTLRGDLIAYNPTQSEIPLVNAGYLIRLLHPSPYFGPTTLTIQRSGSQDIVLEYDRSWPSFDLQPEDHLILKTPSGTEEQGLEERLAQISLKVPGVDAPVFITPVAQPELAPTLVEFLAAAFAPWKAQRPDGIPTKTPSDLGSLLFNYPIPTILPHPDFAKLRIRRLDSEGRESEITFDLVQTAADCTAATSPEQARASDILLQAGDIIELPLQTSPEPWSGFDEDLIRYFKTVLDGAIQLTDRDGNVTLRKIDWQAVRWTPTAAGLLPIPPASGHSSTRPSDLGVYWSEMAITRDGKDLGRFDSSLLLRSGDRIKYSRSQDNSRTTRPRATVR